MSFLERFHCPDTEFSVIPFWFLNGKLSKNETERQMEDFAAKGVMGVVLHPRLGLDPSTPYLSDAYMEQIAFAVKTAKRLGMRVLLYDEGMYPSGSAHGLVVKENPDFAAKCIRLMGPEETETPFLRLAVKMTGDGEYAPDSSRVLAENEKLADGETLIRLAAGFSHGTVRGVHAGEDDGEPGAPAAGDLLNADAMRAFIRFTHDRHYEWLKEYFGDTIIGFFTDEPSTFGRNSLKNSRSWTDGFENDLAEAGFELKDLPALWLKAGGRETKIRADFKRCVTKRLLKTYYGPLSDWCVSHGIALCGHPDSAQESTLLEPFQIPGQDVVWRWVAPENGLALSGGESAQAKCASDAARHTGARRNLNECLGCCGPDDEMWALNPGDIKWYLDWLFVRGCNLIIPHAFFYEVNDLALSDRPPDVGPYNIWWPHYRIFSDYIRRMCMLNTDGVNQTRLAVLGTGDELPVDAVKSLYERQIEFNYLTDDMLLARCQMKDGLLTVEKQAYEAVLTDSNLSYDPRAVSLLKSFEKQGLRVIRRAGNEFKTVHMSGNAKNIRVTHVKRDDAQTVLFVNEGDTRYAGTARLPFGGTVALLDAWTGETYRAEAKDNKLYLELDGRQSLIVAQTDGAEALEEKPNRGSLISSRDLDGRWTWTLPDGTQRKGVFDWKDENFSGTLNAEALVRLKNVPVYAELDLGDVREIATVRVNGNEVGALLVKPYRVNVAPYLKPGENRIEISVTNLPVTKYTGKPWNGGLLGGSRLRIYDGGNA